MKFVNNQNPICKTIKSEIRAGAIKWVKHWLKNLGNPPILINPQSCVGISTKYTDKMDILGRENLASIGAFVNYFNITEDDLRNSDGARK